MRINSIKINKSVDIFTDVDVEFVLSDVLCYIEDAADDYDIKRIKDALSIPQLEFLHVKTLDDEFKIKPLQYLFKNFTSYQIEDMIKQTTKP
jgi:hypothetical protein